MNKNLKKKLDRVEELTKKDIKYKRMLTKCVALERRFDDIISQLSMKERDVVWDFVMLCEDMSTRKLEIACEHMEFTPKVIAFRKKGE